MEAHSQVPSQSGKDRKARGTSKADRSDVGHKGAKKKAKGKGPKHGKHLTTTSEAAETTTGVLKVDQAATVPKPEEEVPPTRPPAEPTSQSLASSNEKRTVVFVRPASGPSSEDPQTEDAFGNVVSPDEKPEGDADHALPPTLPTAVEEHPVETPPELPRTRPSSNGNEDAAPATGTLSAKSRALAALLKTTDPAKPSKRWRTRKPSSAPEKATVIAHPTKVRFGGLAAFLGLRSSAASSLKTGESPAMAPQVQIQTNVEEISMYAFPDDDVKHVQTTSQTTGRVPEPMKTTSQTTPRCASFAANNATAIAFAVITVFTLSFMLLAALLAPSRSRGTVVPGLCSTEDCIMHSRLIHLRTNASVDPCKNFQAFACSAWPASKEIVSFASGTTWDAVVAWYKGFENLLTMSSERYLPAKKALAMYQACMEGQPLGQARHAGMEALKKFMRQRRIPWPGEPDLNVNPLGVLLDFAFNWQTPFWFHVQVLRGNRGQRNTLVLRLGNFITFWSNYHQSLVADQVYYNYLINYFDAFADASDRRPTREEVARMESLHSDVLHRFLELQTQSKKSPAEFPLSEIELYTPNITTAVWVAKLCEHVAIWPEFKDDDQVIVEDTALLETVNAFFVKYDRGEILRHIAWFFVQVFAPLGDIRLLKNKFGDHDKGVENRPVFCATEVEASYGVLLTSVYVGTRLTQQARMQVNRTLTYVINAAVKGINRLSWGNDSSRMAVIEKLNNTRVSLWPPDSLLTWRGLNEMYASFAPHKDSFAEYWVHGHERLRQLAEQPRYGQALEIRPNFVLPLFAYDYVMNTVSIAVTALGRPIFYAQGTAAVDHGGLGFAFARELVKALDGAGLKVDPAGRINDSWVTPHWREQTSLKTNCLSSGKDIFPEVPALQLAYEAYQRRRRESAANLRLSDVWREEQVFFITACFSMCTRTGPVRILTGDCNKAVSNFPAFAQAFQCPSGSPMNPEQKCLYFD
ncbi:hypothetical protein HPB49_002475 [Dermacentor silvarum]|uniref:Uncharacterized protein n=1 Tax=Dermacentor silvarum TaxID=543639 RepID=A0ACB8DMH2_DERSI|nr:hypothetical protein HPB49_002475 [Dermacentor silvarum]